MISYPPPFFSRPPGIRAILAVIVALMIVGVLGILGAADEFIVRHNAFKILSREGRLVAQQFAFGVDMRHEADRFLKLSQKDGGDKLAQVRELVAIRREMSAVLAIRHNVTRVDLLSREEGLPHRVSTPGLPMTPEEKAAHKEVAAGQRPWISVRERKGGDAIYVVVPFLHARRALGTVGVRLSYYEVDALVRKEKNRMAMILLAGFFLLMVGLSLVLKRWLIGPLGRLEQAMRTVGEGDFSKGFDMSGSSEILNAGDSFKQMVEMLQERTREKEELLLEVRRLNAGLTEKIEEKTQELVDKNRALERTNMEMYFIQRRLSELERRAAIGEGMAVVAHELGNPLHSISGHLELLLEEPDLPANIRRTLQILSGQAERMIKAIRKLLVLSRRSDGAREMVFVGPLLADIVGLMEPRLRSAGVEIDLDLGDAPLVLLSDPDALQSLFINLLENALDAIGKNGRIRIFKERAHGSVFLHVCDSGPGIPLPVREHVFDPFFTTKSSGTGLGLSVCRKIVDDLGGSILLGEEPGGHFILIFPEDGSKAVSGSSLRMEGVPLEPRDSF